MESNILMEADISFASKGPGVWKAGDRFMATELEARQMENNRPRLAHRVAQKVTRTVPVKDQAEKPEATKVDGPAESKPQAATSSKAPAKKAAAKRGPTARKRKAPAKKG